MAIGFPLQNTADTCVDIKALRSTQVLFQIRDVDGGVLTAVNADGTTTASTSLLVGEQTSTVTITAAQILALAGTPIELVAAPGAGKVLKFHGAVLLLDHAGDGFAETADNLEIHYNNEAGASVSQTIEMTGFIDQTADTMTTAEPKINVIVAKAGCENQALVLTNINDNFTDTGTTTSVLRVKVLYSVHTTGW